MACVFYSGSAYAAGGACPTGANYLDPSSGSMVTLASLGVTNCYYISAAGSDSNSGTSESSSWLHAPHMPACSGNCAAVQNQSNGIQPGTGMILRGGDTWHLGNSDAAPYTGGSWNFNSGQTPAGTSTHPIYVGVDQTWFSGSSWARPILTADNPVCNASTLGGSCFTSALSGGIVQYYVSSCSFTMAGGSNEMLIFDSLRNFIVDNFEMTGICQSTAGQPGHHDVYVSYGSASGPMSFVNLYIHGWSHLRFAAANGSAGCNGAVCFGILMFQGSVQSGPGENILYTVVDGSDSDGQSGGFCQGGMYDVAYSVISHTSQCITTTMHVFHDNLVDTFFENGHSNVLESTNNGDFAGVNAVYNNIFRNLETSGGSGGVILWPSPKVGSTDYFFNNLMYSVGSMEVFNVGLNGGDQGALAIFNNTFQMNSNSGNGSIFGCQSPHSHPFTVANNHIIIESSTAYSNPCSGLTDVTNLLMSNATAKSKGYTVSQNYVFAPTSSSSPTAGTGTNNGAFCSALSAAASGSPTLSDAAFACQNDTSYACSYNTGSHSVNCPARTVIARPTNTAWDKGAYQSGGTQAAGPNPPSNLAATVN